ncbi:hypothetical protein JIQ42_03889 [Leishmania sp. Namibia]|uniref:hypothetical protein n=1 Tax=Leishmania sp. Namibia TaxID=2802991 RepID=UPI001B711941|nr:hypothetical protein JIQ42_03889 [Leishmania sp. Namibia]
MPLLMLSSIHRTDGGAALSPSLSFLSLLPLLILVILGAGTLTTHGKGIHTTVEASWNETPFYQEGCEWAARSYGDEAFYSCLDALWSPSPSRSRASGIENSEGASDATSARVRTQKLQYTRLLEVLFGLPETHGAQRAFFETEMAARVYSPAVEAHYALADQALRETRSQPFFFERDGGSQGEHDSDNGSTCGEPFAVVYTRAAPGAPLQAVRVETPSALKSAIGGMGHSRIGASVSVDEVAFAGFDHRYLSASMAAAREVSAVMVLYGLPGCPASRALHRTAVELSTSVDAASAIAAGAPAYFWRHLPVSVSRLCAAANPGLSSFATTASVWDTPLLTQGYGVTVDIKNTEYKVLDEKTAAQSRAKEQGSAAIDTRLPHDGADAAAAAASNRVPETQVDRMVSGFHVARLKERYPSLAASLDEFAAFLDEEAGSEDTKVDFDVWELQKIGLAATEYIREVESPHQRLQLLKDMVKRFPTYAAALSRIAAEPGRLEKLQRMLSILHQHMSPGESALFVNGWRVKEQELTLFGVLHALHEEEQLLQRIKTVLTTEKAKQGVHMLPVEPAMLEKVAEYVKRRTRLAMKTLEGDAETEAAYAIPANYIAWTNNVETSPQLKGLPAELNTFFAPDHGHAPIPRRNVLNFVLMLDPVSKSSLQLISLILSLRQQGLIARYGLAVVDQTWSPVFQAGVGSGIGGFQGESAGSRAALKVFALVYHLAAMNKEAGLLKFLVQLFQAAMKTDTETLPDAVITPLCERAAKTQLRTSVAALTRSADVLSHYHETQAALRRFPVPEYPAIFLNGVLLNNDLAAMSAALQREMLLLQEWVSTGALRDDMTSMYDSILKQRGAADHIQPALIGTPVTMLWADKPVVVAHVESLPYVYSPAYAGGVPALTQLVTLPCAFTTAMLQQLQTVMAALEECGAASGENANSHNVCSILRLSLVSCPAAPSLFHRHMEALQRQLTRSSTPKGTRYAVLQRYISHLAEAVASTSVDPGAVLGTETVVAALEVAPLPADVQALIDVSIGTNAKAEPQWSRGQEQFWAAFADAFEVGTKSIALITNGRIIAMDASFSAADVLAAARLMASTTKAVQEAVMNVPFTDMKSAAGGGYAKKKLDTSFFAGKTACLSSVFGDEVVRRAAGHMPTAPGTMRPESIVSTKKDWRRLRSVLFAVSNVRAEEASADITKDVWEEEDEPSGRMAQPLHRVTAVVDPSSRDAQVIVSLADYLLQSPLHIRLTVVLNPALDVKFPIRNFFQYVASPTLVFDETSGRVVAPLATFTQMPSSSLLTLGVEEPPSWTVFSQDAEVDLDNIMLSRLSHGTLFVAAVYRMHSVLLTGEATDAWTGAALNGLPLSLLSPSRAGGTPNASSAARITDTQVMANLGGYYQLQANPGVWYLSVKEGPVAAAYCIEAIGGHVVRECTKGAEESSLTNWTQGQHIPLMIDSFRGRHLPLRVARTPNSAATTNLQAILQQMASKVKLKWPPTWLSRGAKPAPPEKPTLNVFSVASGHLYERFLRMMMHSVHKMSSDKYGTNTTRIKFWVIENFLSPQFKRYIPLLAEQLGFEVGFVTYRWPWWLPRQTEKQRKIWAYKILFLDVLFPLDVDRIIFVDADQTAQADLHELYNMKIGGQAIAMAPFCQKSKNNATIPFRFWEKGFWENHLRGKPYHISAIFLVDLRRFRAMLAGDRYRGIYSQLVGDPNSLQNLDQDLPNFMQDVIPIFSLPEHWLWCETWCSEKSKSKAKTIDLCNNPLTKIPKLENAKMVIPGWEELDNKLQNMSDGLLARL